MSGEICVCRACGHAFFPPRALCSRCGESAPHRTATAGIGVVEQITDTADATVASVRLEQGPVVIARARPDCAREAVVRVVAEDGVAVAVPLTP